MSESLPTVYLCRHGETPWSPVARHSGRKDLPLTEAGEEQARLLGERLRGLEFARAYTSPLSRARRTCELAGFDSPEVFDELMEWDYGDYQGLTAVEVRERNPSWFLFRDGCPGGETLADVAARARVMVDRLSATTGRSIVFAHGHLLRILAVLWLRLEPDAARLLLLKPASISILAFEHDRREEPIIKLWNDRSHLDGDLT